MATRKTEAAEVSAADVAEVVEPSRPSRVLIVVIPFAGHATGTVIPDDGTYGAMVRLGWVRHHTIQ